MQSYKNVEMNKELLFNSNQRNHFKCSPQHSWPVVIATAPSSSFRLSSDCCRGCTVCTSLSSGGGPVPLQEKSGHHNLCLRRLDDFSHFFPYKNEGEKLNQPYGRKKILYAFWPHAIYLFIILTFFLAILLFLVW